MGGVRARILRALGGVLYYRHRLLIVHPNPDSIFPKLDDITFTLGLTSDYIFISQYVDAALARVDSKPVVYVVCSIILVALFISILVRKFGHKVTVINIRKGHNLREPFTRLKRHRKHSPVCRY